MDLSDLQPTERERLTTFVARVAGSPHNLVSRADRERLWERHVADCLAIAPQLPPDAVRVLDVGSGGGFPGVVLAIVRPRLEVHLLEATAKKAHFLEDVVDELGLAVDVHRGRAEELANGPLRAAFDVVTARAVAPLPRLLPWLAPFVRPGGVIMAMKGDRWHEELEQAQAVIESLHLHVRSTPNDPVRVGGSGDDQGPRLVILARTDRLER